MTPLTKTFLAVFIAGLSGIIVDFCNFNLRGIALPSTVIFFGLILVRFALEKIGKSTWSKPNICSDFNAQLAVMINAFNI